MFWKKKLTELWILIKSTKISGIKQNFLKILKFLLNIAESSLTAKLENVEEFSVQIKNLLMYFKTRRVDCSQKTIYFSFNHKIVHKNLFFCRFWVLNSCNVCNGFITFFTIFKHKIAKHAVYLYSLYYVLKFFFFFYVLINAILKEFWLISLKG